MNTDLASARVYIGTIVDWLQQRTGLTSRWNGQLYVSEDVDVNGMPAFSAKKEWNCAITIHQTLLQRSDIVETLVHECLHSVSMGMEPLSYLRFRGYEEGIVELATRLLGPEIAISIGATASFESRIAYNHYVELLQKLRAETGKAERDFTLQLLGTSLANRDQTVVEWVINNNPQEMPIRVIARIASLQRGLRGQR